MSSLIQSGRVAIARATILLSMKIESYLAFKFSNTTQRTMESAGKLLSVGINPSEIYQKCYESSSKDMVLFQSYCVNKAEFLNDDKIAYTIVYKKDLEKFNNQGEDFTDGLTEKLRAIRTTEVAFVVKELNSKIKKQREKSSYCRLG